ncbi:MAG: MarR family transcriptional regulator [Omnitrophica WOR_2 bacterium]|jgi:predicted transcriptional regulator
MEKEDLVLEVLKKSEAPLKSAQIAELANLDKKDVDSVIKKLKQAEKVISPKVCFYTVKK